MFSFIKKYKYFLLLACLILFSLQLYFSNSRDFREFNPAEKFIIDAVVPAAKVISSGLSAIGNIFSFIGESFTAREENVRLKNEITSLSSEMSELRETSAENQRLKELLNYRDTSKLSIITAKVVNEDPTAWFKAVLIDKGDKDGVRKGMAVVLPVGMAGRIIQVTENASKVLLIIDLNSNVDCYVQRTRARGILEGKGSGICRLKYIQRSEDIKVGDYVVTTGLGGVIPKGLVLGMVTKVDKKSFGIFQAVEVTPTVDFRKLEEVLIVRDTFREKILEELSEQ